MKKIGIIGGAGYTGGEAIRLLINHPEVELAWVQSGSNGGNLLADVHADLVGETEMRFVAEADFADVLFICSGHGEARKWLEANPLPAYTKVIDLSQDFRLAATSVLDIDHTCPTSSSLSSDEARRSDAGSLTSTCSQVVETPQGRDGGAENVRRFVYGLPEVNRAAIASADSIANPGCFATCLQLGLLPLAAGGHLTDDVNICATTGSTGAGQKPTTSTHFSWRAGNLSIYKPFEHQHLGEIGETICGLQPSWEGEISFIPARGAFTRGIFASIWTRSELSEAEAVDIYKRYYADAAFTFVADRPVDLKQVVNTNKCLVCVEKHGDKLLITSMIDNLLKGASGQAVQNMNLMLGLDERAGLRLKASAF